MFKNSSKCLLLTNKNVRIRKSCIRNYEIPCHLQKVISDPNPSFYRMVEYFYHFAVKVIEPALFEYLKKHTHFSEKKRKQRVAGILKVLVTFLNELIYRYSKAF